MPKERPKNLDLSSVQFPVTATASILHRVSGIIIFIALSILLLLLNCSLRNQAGFDRVAGYTDGFVVKFILWGTLTAIAYHAVFGVRHMIQDLGHWEEMQSASVTAKAGFVIVVVLSVLAGVLVW
ncbi:MAG: succinate dehydrogenase, cytochrome b556 subunit [Psychromonas sp.]|nr:succinate dehydrogenase, cytochrome b556 subunit [Psychromonas sp.]